MDEEQTQKDLRGAVHRRDTAGVIAVLSAAGLGTHRLQMAGIGLLNAVQDDRAAAEPLARSLLDALAQRRWDGDEELAAELSAALGDGPAPPLKEIPASLSEIADAMNTSDWGGRINLQDGEVYPAVLFNYDTPEELDEEDFDDPKRWLGIDPAGSDAGWQDMADFIDAVTDPGRADRLSIAIEGRGAFRRFKDVLHRWPDEAARWYAFSEDRKLGRAREWLAVEGYRTTRY
jgi:hypothetical protein